MDGANTFLLHDKNRVKLPPADVKYEIKEEEGVALLVDGDGMVPCTRVMEKALKQQGPAGENNVFCYTCSKSCQNYFPFCFSIWRWVGLCCRGKPFILFNLLYNLRKFS